MPELPEIETIRLFLDDVLVNKEIVDVNILEERMFHGKKEDLLNSKIIATDRRGKVLILVLKKDKEKKYLSFHLKLSGQGSCEE